MHKKNTYIYMATTSRKIQIDSSCSKTFPVPLTTDRQGRVHLSPPEASRRRSEHLPCERYSPQLKKKKIIPNYPSHSCEHVFLCSCEHRSPRWSIPSAAGSTPTVSCESSLRKIYQKKKKNLISNHPSHSREHLFLCFFEHRARRSSIP